MRHQTKPSIFKSRLGLFIIVVAVVVLILIIFGSRGSDTDVVENQTENESLNQEQDIIKQVNVEPEEKGELEQVIEKTLSEKGLCEDYNFNEGDSLEIKNTEVTLVKISTTSAKLIVGEKTFFLSSGDDEVVDELRIELHEGNLLYFGAEDSENLAILTLGCKYSDEDSNEKYVRERGVTICREVYDQCTISYDECKDSFGID